MRTTVKSPAERSPNPRLDVPQESRGIDRRQFTQILKSGPKFGYAFLNALAMLLNASSRVLRDVAIFIRIWFSPPDPNHFPATN